MRIALGLSYNGTAYQGWQSQLGGLTVQDKLEAALGRFCELPRVPVLCAGRTDTGVHGLMQVVHFDTEMNRSESSWVRGPNSFLPPDIAVQWARVVPREFHCRSSALSRRYSYVLLQSVVRPSVEVGRVGWVYHPLDLQAMQSAAQTLLGEHDFTSFRASACQALSPVKNLLQIQITQKGGFRENAGGSFWRFDFEANSFLHHMIRNMMGCLVAVGQHKKPAAWMQEVLDAKSRDVAAPTFAADGLYFLGPRYAPHWNLPDRTPAYDWLP